MSAEEELEPVAVDIARLEEGIDEDGLVEDGLHEVETRYCRIEWIGVADGYLRVVGDHPGDFVEIRIPFEWLPAIGITPPDPSFVGTATGL